MKLTDYQLPEIWLTVKDHDDTEPAVSLEIKSKSFQMAAGDLVALDHKGVRRLRRWLKRWLEAHPE